MALRISDFTDEEYLKYLQIGGGDISPYQGRSLTDEEKNSIKDEILFRFDYNIGNFLKNAHFYTPKERNEARINMVSQTFEEGRSFYGLSAPRSNEEAFSGEDFRNMILYDPYVTEDMNYYYDRFAESRVGEGKINFPNLGGMTKKQFIDSFKAKNYLDDVTTRDEILTRRYGKENYEAQREEDGRHRDSAWMYSLRQTKNLFGQTLQLFGETADSVFGDPATDGGFWDWFTKVGDQWSRNAVREIEEGGYQRKYNESFAETLRKKGPAAAMGKAFEMAAENWSNSGLSLALALVPGGGAYRATKILRGAAKYVAPLFSMLEAGGVREEMIEQGVYDPTKPMGAAIWGTAAAALDWVENMYVGGKMPASYLRNRLFSQLERTHARRAAQDKFTREMLNELKRPFWYKLGRGVTIEGVTEGLQELAPIMASYQAETEENKLRKPYDWTFNISNPGSVLNRIVDASVVGGLMGGTTVTTAHTVGTISGDRKRRIDQLSGLTGQTSPTTTPNYNGTSNGQPIQVNVPGAPNGTNYFQLQNNNWLATNGVYTGEGDTAENAVKQMFSVANKDHVPLSDPIQSASDTFTLTSIIPAGSTANSLTVDVVGNNAQTIAEQVRDLHNNTTGNIVNLKATAANNGQIRIETNNIGSDLLTYLENLSTSEQRAEFPGLEARQLHMVRARNVPDALELDVFHYQHDNAQFEESDFFSEQDDTETKRQQRLKKISDDFRRMGFDFINTRPHKRPARSTSLKEIKVHKNGVIYTISLNTQSGSQGRDVQATVVAESLDGKAIKLPKGIAAQTLSTSSTAHRGKVYFRLPTDRISVTQLQGMSGSNPTYQFESSEITRLFANTLGANITTNEADTVDFELDGKTGHMRIANDGTVLLHADGFLVSNFEFVGDLVQLGMGTAQGSTVEQAVIAGTNVAPTSAYTDVVMPDLNQVPQDVRPLLPRVNADGEYAVKYLKKSTGTTDEYYAIYLDGKYATRGTYYSKLGPNHPMPKILKVLETMFGNPRPARPTTVPDYEKFFSDNFGSQFNSTNVVQIIGGAANNKYIRVGYNTLNQRLTDNIIYANTFSNNDVSVNFSGPGFNPVKVYTLSDSAGNTRAIRAYTDAASQQQALEELYDAAPFLANIIDGGVFAENPARQEENYIRQNDAPPEAIYDETNFTNKYDRQDSTHKNIMSDIRDYHNNIRLLCEEMSIIFNYIITNQKYDVMTTITASNIAVRDILNKLTQSILDVNGKTNLKNQMDLLAQALNITGGNTNNLTLDEVRTLFAMELKRTYAKFAAFMYIVESARRNSINSGNLATFMNTNIGGSSYSVNDIANDNLRNVITRNQLNTETEEIFAGVNAVIQSTVPVGVQPFSIGDFGNIQNLTGKDYTNDNVDIIISNVTNLNRVKFYRTTGDKRANRRVKGKEITIADELDLSTSVGRDVVDGLTRNGRLVILETQEQAELVLNAINAEINYGKNGVTAGFTDLNNGVIYLVQDGIRVGEAAGALYHEFGVHLKRFGFTDSQFRDILTSLQLRVENMRQGNVLDEFYSEMADLVEEKGLSRQDPLFWEEVNAHIITEAMNRNVADMDLIAKSVSWIKSFLYRHGFIKAENLNYQDLVNIIRSAMRTEVRENNPPKIPGVIAVRFLINTNANVEIPSAIPGAPGVYQYRNGRTFIVQNELPRGLESETMMYGQAYANLGLIRRNPIVGRLRTEILANDYLREKITEDAAELGVDINSDTGRRKIEDLAIGLGVRRILTDPNIDDSLYQDTLDVFRDVVGDAVHLSYDQEYISPSTMAAAAGALSSIPPVRLDVPLREGFAARKRQGITDIVWDDVNERLKLVEENSDYVVIDNAPSVQLADGAYMSFEGAQDNATSVREALHDLSTRTIDEGIDDDFFYRENPNLEAFEQTGRSYGILAEMANRYNVEDFINKALPAHIADRIEVHYNETDYAKGILKKAAGIIFPFSYTKKIIHVRAWGRTLGEVIRTIGHEVSHFGWSIWNVPEFNNAIVNFYDKFEDTLMNTIPEYFAQIGYANPTPGNSLQALLSENEKIFLVNEFYSHINASLLDDTTPNVADAMGIDSTEYAKIRDEINNGIALIETKISDIFGNTNVTQDTAKAFAKDMLKMTFGSVIGRKLNIVFDQGRPNNVGFPNTRIRIFANEFGVVRRVEPLTKDAERSANYKEVVTKWDKYFSDIDPKWGKYGKMFAKFMLANIPMSNHIPGLHVEGAKLGDTPTGRITLMVGRLWQRIANSFQIDIKEKFNLMQELNAILMDNNYDPSYISYTNFYTDVFRRLGLSQKDIEKAKLLDDSINYMRKLIYEGSVEIQKAFYETGRRLRQRMLAPGTGISQARADAVYNRFIQLASSFHSNWEHRSYEAFTQEGQADLKEMLHYLNLDSVNGQDGIYSQAATAQSFIDTSEALLRNGQISENEYQRRTKEARHTIEIKDRLEALREYVNIRMRQANMTPDGNWNAIVVRNMKAEINEIIKKANQLHSGALGREHLNMISASKGRKLDENFIVDQKYMKFLKQIQNPIYVLIDSIDQQRKIVEKIRFNIEVGEYILDSGMGSLREQKGVSGIDDSLALSFLEKGSFLEYIEVDPFFLEDIQKEIEIVKHANEIMWRGIIDAWKANSTIYNLRLGINNHVSNVGMLVFAGHAFRLGQIMSGHHIAKSQFLSKFRPDQDGNLSDFEKKMMRWLHQYRVFGGTVSEMELVTRNTGWHEKVVHATTSMLKAMSFLENRSGHHFESFMLKWIERMRQFYAFGDEWVKPLIFINNWNNFYAKYDASESLANGETEEQRIARVEELAARDAAEQTLRESTTWEYSPQFIRQLSTNAARQFTPDFIMHNFQMLRIMSSNVVRWAELWRELVEFGRKQNKTAKDYKWGKAITAELAQRSVGLGLLGGSFAGLAGLFGVGGAQLMAFVPYLMNVLYKGLGGDDDDEKMQEKNIRRAGNELVDKNGNILEERGWFTPNEWDGWQRLLNFMTGGNNLYAPAWRRDNESISAWNWLRSNVMYTHAPVMPAKENPLLKDRALIILQNIANINGETMARQFVENAFGRDRYGNDIGLIEGWKQIAERTLMPGGVRQIMGATIGYPFSDTRYHEGRFIKSTELFGLHFNNYDRKDIANKLGFFMAERMEGGKNRIRKNLILRLQDSRDYTNEEIASMIRDAMADNLNSFNKANYVLIGLRKTYMPEEDIKHYLHISRNTGGIVLGKELVEKYVNGVNIFDTSLVEALNNRRNQLIEKKRTLRMNPDQYDVAIRNLGTAIRMYRRALDRNER